MNFNKFVALVIESEKTKSWADKCESGMDGLPLIPKEWKKKYPAINSVPLGIKKYPAINSVPLGIQK